MSFKVGAVIFLALSGCVTARSSCQTDASDMGFVECDSPIVSACGVTLLNCEDGVSYYCVPEAICENKKDVLGGWKD